MSSEHKNKGRKRQAPSAMRMTSKTRLGPLGPLAAELGITDWDVLLAGDGSGQAWDRPCGWATVLIDRVTARRAVFYGAVNRGTCALAELLPYIHALAWYEATLGEARRRDRAQPIRVAIVTDSRHLADQGNALVAGHKTLSQVKAFRGFWAALIAFESAGYAFSFHWCERLGTALNSYCDDLAGQSRRALLLRPVRRPVSSDGRAVRVSECNPSSADAVALPAPSSPRRRRPETPPP